MTIKARQTARCYGGDSYSPVSPVQHSDGIRVCMKRKYSRRRVSVQYSGPTNVRASRYRMISDVST